MNIVTPYAKIENHPRSQQEGIFLLQDIERFGRVSHRSEDLQNDSTWEKFIRSVILQHGDWSITEHRSVTVETLIDRGITHEWVRHRIGAYTQESTRFVNYDKKIPASFIKPHNLQITEGWEVAVSQAEFSYKEMIRQGVAPQIARSVFPNALASKLIVTYNLRSWRHFFLMRTSKESHPQMREVTIPLLREFQERIPILYEDIIPESRQVENMRLPR